MAASRSRLLALSAAIAVLNAILTIISIAVPFAVGTRRFDNPKLLPSQLERVCSFLASILVQPANEMLTALGITLRNSAAEWSVLLLSSTLWGTVIALIVGLLGTRRKQIAR